MLKLNQWLMIALIPSFGLSAAPCKQVYGDGATEVRLATGSPGELGAVKALADAFNQDHDSRICWVKAGSGKSLKLLKQGEVDLVMVHAPAAEKAAVKEGWAKDRTLIGSNEFYFVGPVNDPAQVHQANTIAEAYQRIADTQSRFLSRGDNSGTHKKELMIWSKADIAPKGDWYVTTKSFMRATLRQANREQGYFMTDSSTWITEKAKLTDLKVQFQGDPILVNTYHALHGNKHDAKGKLAESFVHYLGSDKGQQLFSSYGDKEYGQPLYTGAADTQDH